MIVYPAIDLLGGRVVRLRQGAYDAVTVYHEDPVAMAQTFKTAGATWIHVVDLDAAKSGRPVHRELIKRLRQTVGLKVQTGGGIRTMEHLEALLEDGIDRAVLGTAAVKDPDFAKEAVRRFGEKVAIGVDARQGEVKISGWTEGSGERVEGFVRKIARWGTRTIVYTDISRDGMLTGIAADSTRAIIDLGLVDVIASGGIGCAQDLEVAREIGAAGVIVGKAIYEGKVKVEQCWQKE